MLSDVRAITRQKQTGGDFFAPGALIQVKNGKGLLRVIFLEKPADAAYCPLLFGDQPLFQL